MMPFPKPRGVSEISSLGRRQLFPGMSWPGRSLVNALPWRYGTLPGTQTCHTGQVCERMSVCKRVCVRARGGFQGSVRSVRTLLWPAGSGW